GNAGEPVLAQVAGHRVDLGGGRRVGGHPLRGRQEVVEGGAARLVYRLQRPGQVQRRRLCRITAQLGARDRGRPGGGRSPAGGAGCGRRGRGGHRGRPDEHAEGGASGQADTHLTTV